MLPMCVSNVQAGTRARPMLARMTEGPRVTIYALTMIVQLYDCILILRASYDCTGSYSCTGMRRSTVQSLIYLLSFRRFTHQSNLN
jgi:hypothetical protein